MKEHAGAEGPRWVFQIYLSWKCILFSSFGNRELSKLVEEVAITRYNYATALHGMGEKKTALVEMKRPPSMCISKYKQSKKFVLDLECVQIVISSIPSAILAARLYFNS